jgi:hypothetical protein
MECDNSINSFVVPVTLASSEGVIQVSDVRLEGLEPPTF